MTSKEALENWYNTESPRTKAYEYEQHYRLIKKDLEVLEILKKYYKSYGWSNGGIIEFWGMTKTQLKKVREWLENE